MEHVIKSLVHLVGSCDNFPKKEKEIDKLKKEKYYAMLTPSMLKKPIMGRNGSILTGDMLLSYRSALEALASLEGYTSVVSFGFRDQMIILPNQEWCEIYDTGTKKLILSFSHDTRNNKTSFYNLIDWVEESWGPINFLIGAKRWSTFEIWRAFFITRLQNKISGSPSERKAIAALTQRCQNLLPH